MGKEENKKKKHKRKKPSKEEKGGGFSFFGKKSKDTEKKKKKKEKHHRKSRTGKSPAPIVLKPGTPTSEVRVEPSFQPPLSKQQPQRKSFSGSKTDGQKQQQKSSDQIQKSSDPKSSDKANAKIAAAPVINNNPGDLKNPKSPHRMKTKSPRKKSTSKRQQEEKLRKSSDQKKGKSPRKKSVQIKSASKSNSKASEKVQKSSEPTKSSDKKSKTHVDTDPKNPKSPHRKKKSQSPRIKSTSKSESKRKEEKKEEKRQKSPDAKKKAKSPREKSDQKKSSSKSQVKNRRSPKIEYQDSETDVIPFKKKNKNLSVNINEVLRIGSVLERFGLDEQRRKSYEWLAEHRNEALRNSPKVAFNLIVAMGDLNLTQELVSNVLKVLLQNGSINQKEYFRHFAPLEKSNIQITVAQFAHLLTVYGTKYQTDFEPQQTS